MKVRVEMTVDIDPDVWQMNYGTATEDIRKDVREYCFHTIQQQLDTVGVWIS